MKRPFSAVLALLLAGLAFAEGQQAAPVVAERPSGWPGWRGPNHDGISTETGWNAKALEGGAKILWTAMIGAGYSNIAVAGGKLYATGSRDNQLLFSCLDAASGGVVWQHVFEDLRGEAQSTPAVDGDRVYALTKFGYLLCLDTADGGIVWRNQLPPTPNAYLWATSPVIDGNLVLINAGHAGMAIDKTTGDTVWYSGTSSKNSPVANAAEDYGKASYTSPVVFDLQGIRAVLFLGPTALSAVEASTGKVLWSKPHWRTEITADPMVSGNLVFVRYSTPTVFEASRSGARVLWSGGVFADDRGDSLTSPILLNGYLYLVGWDIQIPGNSTWVPVKRKTWPLVCVELKTGKVAWTESRPYVQLTGADGKLLMLDLDGALTVVEATPAGFRPISSADVLAGADRPRLFPTPPVLVDGRVYCRNYAGDLVCIDMTGGKK